MSTGISIWAYSSKCDGHGWRFAYVDDGETFEYSGTYDSCLDAINAASDVVAAECGDEADAVHVPSMLASIIRADLDGCDIRVIGY